MRNKERLALAKSKTGSSEILEEITLRTHGSLGREGGGDLQCSISVHCTDSSIQSNLAATGSRQLDSQVKRHLDRCK